ncbi:aldolase, partial [Streptomyces sp. NPDC059409]
AALAGGPANVTALRGPYPHDTLGPGGGDDEAAARAHLAAGATAVGVGSPLIGDAADGGSLDALRTRARAFRAAVAEARP